MIHGEISGTSTKQSNATRVMRWLEWYVQERGRSFVVLEETGADVSEAWAAVKAGRQNLGMKATSCLLLLYRANVVARAVGRGNRYLSLVFLAALVEPSVVPQLRLSLWYLRRVHPQD